MATVGDERLGDGKLDLVPMIDCIMLLLLFFILTTRVHRDELGISSLLPTEQGPAQAASVTPPQTVTIRVFPAGMEHGLQPSDYLQQLRTQRSGDGRLHAAWLRIGVRPPLSIDLTSLDVRDPRAAGIVDQVHAYIADALQSYENATPADRRHQAPVTIACFSQLPWKASLLAYDAVRAFEASRLPPRDPAQADAGTTGIVDVDTARAVDFAPPRVRDSTSTEEGQELFEIVNMK